MKTIMVALLFAAVATSAAEAQSQRNFGPNGPARGDCFGEPYSGTIAARCGGHYWHHQRYR